MSIGSDDPVSDDLANKEDRNCVDEDNEQRPWRILEEHVIQCEGSSQDMTLRSNEPHCRVALPVVEPEELKLIFRNILIWNELKKAFLVNGSEETR